MGDVFGSFGFDLVAQDIYEAVTDKFPQTLAKALTDDLNIAIPPASASETVARDIFKYVHTEAKRVAGMQLNLSKCYLLLPADGAGPCPPPDFPSGLKIVTEGLKIAGAPIGTDSFCRQFVADALKNLTARLHALPGIDPQTGLGLLRVSIASAPIFLAQVTPTLVVGDLFTAFDQSMAQCALDVAQLPRSRPAPYCSEDRMRRARQRIRLPIRHKGAGILSIADRHPAAFFASVATSTVTDRHLQEHAPLGLSRHAVHAHEKLCELLGPSSTDNKHVNDFCPRNDPLAMLNYPLFQDLFEKRALEKQPELKLQRELSRAIASRRAADLLQEESEIGVKGVRPEDLVDSHTQGNPAQAFRARLSEYYNRIPSNWFVAWFRRFLRIPQLQRLGNAEPRFGHDADLEQCCGSHSSGPDRFLDVFGVHDNSSCPPCAKGRAIGHTAMKRGLARFGRLAKVRAEVEPQTHDLLRGQFTSDQCAILFPKRPAKAYRDEIKSLLRNHHQLALLPCGEERKRKQLEFSQDVVKLSLRAPGVQERKGLRIDVQLTDLTTDEELWVDVTSWCPLVPTDGRLRKEVARTMERKLSDIKQIRERSSVTVELARATKLDDYGMLALLGQKQAIDGKRAHAPQFTPLTVTTQGEHGPGATLTREWLAKRYRQHLDETSPRADGSDTNALVGRYRDDFNMMLRMAIIRRIGAMATVVGLPDSSTRSHPLPPRAPAPAPLLQANQHPLFVSLL
jgi:hypothetical protein